MTYADAPDGNAQCPDGSTPPADTVMHAGLSIDGTEVDLSDGMSSGKPDFKGYQMTLVCADDAQARRRSDASADGGRVPVPSGQYFLAACLGMPPRPLLLGRGVLAPQ